MIKVSDKFKRFFKPFIVPLVLLIVIILFINIKSWASFYSHSVYPLFSKVLYSISSTVRFSFFDLLIIVVVIYLIVQIVKLFIKGKRLRSLKRILLILLWTYDLFYLCWGINYFSPGFMNTNEISRAKYDAESFNQFLNDYVADLNKTYKKVYDENGNRKSKPFSDEKIDTLIIVSAESLNEKYHMPYFPSTMRTKNMLLSRFYASMGVRGYYSPFFAEAHVNPLFLEHERFPVKAHELAHLGGITSEAEANLIAYLIATNSDESEIQFDGNMFILSYVIRNARNFLPEEEYKHFLGRIDSGVMSLFNNSRQYWSDLYSDKVGSVQDFFYDFYLKRNNIPSGQANYSEVISLIIALREKEK